VGGINEMARDRNRLCIEVSLPRFDSLPLLARCFFVEKFATVLGKHRLIVISRISLTRILSRPPTFVSSLSLSLPRKQPSLRRVFRSDSLLLFLLRLQNVARTVTKDGLYTIRGEFMRASRILTGRPERAVTALAQLCEGSPSFLLSPFLRFVGAE